MNREEKASYMKERSSEAKLKRESDNEKAELARIAGIKDLETNKVVYRVKGSNANYSSYIKAELSTMDIVEINRTVAIN